MPPLNEYKYCSTQVNLNGHASTRVLMAGDMIPDEVLGVEGRETQPHLTIQYGIETDNAEAIRTAVRGIRPFEITLGLTDAFPPSEHSSGDSPLFVTVKKGTEQLVALRNAIRAAGPVHDSFPVYTPHVCVAYVKNEHVDAMKGKDWLAGTVALVSGVTFSNREGEQTYIPFGVNESAVPRINRLLVRIGEGVEPENDMQRALFDYERSVAAQDAKTWARDMARKAFASSPVLSKNTEDTYYRKYLRDHARSVAFVKRLNRQSA